MTPTMRASPEPVSGRTTPYERVFGDERFEVRDFPAIREEAVTRGLNPGRRDEFALVSRVGLLLQELAPEDADRQTFAAHRETLFHVYHFWAAGRRIYAFEAPVLRRLVDSPPVMDGWTPRAPAASAYVELPRQVFWGAVAEGMPPEPVEGFFLRAEPESAVGPIRTLDLLLILGLRPNRAGFSQVGLTEEIEEVTALEEGSAFRSDIPGADLAGLYSVQRSSEATLLALRTLWYLDTHPEAVRPAHLEGATDEEAVGRTRLDHYRVSLIEGSTR